MQDFGIYIKTFEPDYHLAQALVASLEEHAPGVPVMLVPDDGFEGETLWGLPVLQAESAFVASLEGYYKKLWVFFGPYERFLYLDADMLALHDVRPLVERIRTAEPPFFMVCAETKMLDKLGEPNTESIYESHIGNLSLLRAFDSKYRWEAQFPFNSGLFATHKGFIHPEQFKKLLTESIGFQKQHQKPSLMHTREGLFMGDQGFINYLVAKSGAELTLLQDAFVWGGKPWTEEAMTPTGDVPYRGSFVHWAGCPRPAPGRTDVPAGKEWAHYYEAFWRERGGMPAAPRRETGIVRRLRKFFQRG